MAKKRPASFAAELFLRDVQMKNGTPDRSDFPFSIPLVRGFEGVRFTAPVTYLVGENGSGKSTFLEALAVAAGSVSASGTDLRRDPTLEAARRLAEHLRLAWARKTRRGFFLRAEDFFNFARNVNAAQAEFDDMAADYEKNLSGHGLQLARGVARGQKSALAARYGADADARSHGESFLHFFQERFAPGGLYLLDEPEAPLSPQRQLAFLALLKDMVARDAQFVIATHSPILMAMPGAALLNFDATPIAPMTFDDAPHVAFTRAFLNNPGAYLRHL
jgi:predicted ATPase